MISERNDFSNSKSTCCPNGSCQVSVQSGLRFWRRWRLKWRPSWIKERNDYPCRPDTSHQVSAQSDFSLERRCRLKNFKMAAMGHLGYLNETTSAILNHHVVPIPPIRFQLNPIFCRLKNNKMATILAIETERIEQL